MDDNQINFQNKVIQNANNSFAFGIFSIFPGVAFITGVIAIFLGFKSYKLAKKDNIILPKKALIGIILGIIFIILNLFILYFSTAVLQM